MYGGATASRLVFLGAVFRRGLSAQFRGTVRSTVAAEFS
jgi:hypothetical protein